MKAKSLALVVLLCTAALVSHAGDKNSFDEGSLDVVFGFIRSANNNEAGAVMVGLSSAHRFGKNNTSEIAFEWLNSVWGVDRYDDLGQWVRRDNEHHMPVMLNYRYHVRIPRTGVALHAGIGAGFAFMSTPYRSQYPDDDNEDVVFNGDKQPGFWASVFDEVSRYYDASFVASGMAGVTVRISEYTSIEAGYRLMWQSGNSCRIDDRSDPDYNRGRGTHMSWTNQDRLSFVSVSARFWF